MENQKLLNEAIKYGILDLPYLQGEISLKKKAALLEKHPYAIYEGRDGLWHTYLPDAVKGRISRKRKSKEELEDLVIEYWKDKEDNPTVASLFYQWITAKTEREAISKSTRDRYIRQFTQCFYEFGNWPIKDVSEYDIEEFMLNAIHECDLTTKGFSNMRTLVYGIFKHAKKKRLVSFSITEMVKDVEISRKLFRRNNKEDDEQVFMVNELPMVLEYLRENLDVINLGILLLFESGLRIGELAALKKCDIAGRVIHVTRTEICYEDDRGNRVFEIRDFPKTEAGIRDVIIPQSYTWIFTRLKQENPSGEFLFMSQGSWIRTYVFRNRLKTICKKLDIKMKSPHKVRKTYGTILLDNGVEESLILSQMGHVDIRTTKGHYYKNRKNDNQKAEVIDSIIGL